MRPTVYRSLLNIGLTAATIAFVGAPMLAAGQTTAAQGLLGTLALFNRILNGLVGLAILVAILAFFWGLIQWMFSSGGEAKSDGLKFMFYSVISIFVMVSIWGIIRLLQNTFGVTQNTSITPDGIRSF
jgi:hypothetical protein